jgi:hypothetical protein
VWAQLRNRLLYLITDEYLAKMLELGLDDPDGTGNRKANRNAVGSMSLAELATRPNQLD